MIPRSFGTLLSALRPVLFGVAALAAIPDAQTWAQKWANRAAAAAPDYVAGAEATDKDPTALAIANGQRYIGGVTDAFNSGRWANGLRKAGKQGWLNGVTGKGAQAYPNGVRNSVQKAAEKIAPVLAYEAQLQTQVRAMPNATDQDRVNRAVAWITGMRRYKTGV